MFISCALPQNVKSIQSDIYKTKIEVNKLQALESDTKQTITAEMKVLKKKLDEHYKRLNDILTDFEMRLQALEDENRQLKGTIEELKFLLSSGWGERTSSLQKGEISPSGNNKEGEIFKIAMRDYNKGQINACLASLNLFLKDYPHSSQAPQAQYTIGKCYLANKKYEKAVQSFIKTQEDYPSSDIAPDALYQAAESYILLSKHENALATLHDLVSMYPEYERIVDVKKKINELTQKAGED